MSSHTSGDIGDAPAATPSAPGSTSTPATTPAVSRTSTAKTQSAKETRPPQGIFEVASGIASDGSPPLVDIVAVHGLDGHAFRSWTAPTPSDTLWLRDLLPAVLPRARVALYGYDGWAHGSEPLSQQRLFELGQSLVSALWVWRKESDAERRPIIFIAHSLGGIVVKAALIHANSATPKHLPHQKAIKLSTYGVCFIGTPHQGTAMVPLYRRLLSIMRLWKYTSDGLLRHMGVNSEFLQMQQASYRAIAPDFDTRAFYETLPSKLPFSEPIVIVETWSAVVPGQENVETVALTGDHRAINKYPSADDENFKAVSSRLADMVDKCYRRPCGHTMNMWPTCRNCDTKVEANWREWDRLVGGAPANGRVGPVGQRKLSSG